MDNLKVEQLLLILLSSFMVAVSQNLLKYGALRYGASSWWRQYFNIAVIAAYLIFWCVTLINVYIFSFVPLSFANIMVAITYIPITLSGYYFFKERISNHQSIGIILTIIGIILYSIGM